MTRIKKIIPLIPITIAILLLQDIFRTKIIIYFGITIYNIVHIVPIVLWAVVVAYVVYAVARNIADRKHQKIHNTDNVYVETPITEIQTNEEVKAELFITLKHRWPMLHIDLLIKQFDEFDVYQANIEELLKQARDLDNRPLELMQKLEDTMYLNARVLLNYMRVLQERDLQIMQTKLTSCHEKNALLLDKGQNFVLAITDYVNQDLTKEGEKQRVLDKINSYMFVTLDAIEAPEIRLT